MQGRGELALLVGAGEFSPLIDRGEAPEQLDIELRNYRPTAAGVYLIDAEKARRVRGVPVHEVDVEIPTRGVRARPALADDPDRRSADCRPAGARRSSSVDERVADAREEGLSSGVEILSHSSRPLPRSSGALCAS